jgi:hypothetical protein
LVVEKRMGLFIRGEFSAHDSEDGLETKEQGTIAVKIHSLENGNLCKIFRIVNIKDRLRGVRGSSLNKAVKLKILLRHYSSSNLLKQSPI